MFVDPALVDALIAFGASRVGSGAAPVVLSDRAERVLLRFGDVVIKAHARGTDPAALAARLRVAADPELAQVLLAPLTAPSTVAGRLVSLWPAGRPVAAALDAVDLDAAPWEQAGTLLARLHRVAPPPGLPPAGGPAGVERALNRLAGVAGPAAEAVRRAARGLPALTGGSALAHGDWHLGQLVERDGWRLIDVDDLGLGDPAWDLARPAGLWAVGLLEPDTWARFLAGYRAAGGPAVPADGDPWPALDGPARALVVRMAAQAVVRAGAAGLPDTDQALIDACVRMS